jgi:signal transduction histidine kinase
LEAINSDLELYASLLRHDLRNDLHIILTQIESTELLLGPESDSAEACEITKFVATRMTQLLNIFESPDEKIPDNILQLLEKSARNAEKTHPGLKVKIHSSDPNSELRIRRGRLFPALFDNLFRNSFQYAGPKVTVDVTVKRLHKTIQIDVSDSGPGIPKKIRSKLFQKGVSTTGGGLGLYLSKRIVEAYGGSIELRRKSAKCKGACFRIILPSAK